MGILDLANKKTKTMTKKNTCSHTLWAIHDNPYSYDWKRKMKKKGQKERFQQNLLRESWATYNGVLVWHLDLNLNLIGFSQVSN